MTIGNSRLSCECGVIYYAFKNTIKTRSLDLLSMWTAQPPTLALTRECTMPQNNTSSQQEVLSKDMKVERISLVECLSGNRQEERYLESYKKVEHKKKERIKQIAADRRTAQKFFLIQVRLQTIQEFNLDREKNWTNILHGLIGATSCPLIYSEYQ